MNNSTVRGQIADELAAIVPFDALETEHKADVAAWLQSGANLFRIQKPDKPPKHLVSYFVVIDPARRSVLLGDHINAQLWLPSGGHVKLNEHPRQTVIREAREELGLKAKFLNGRERPFFVTVGETVGLTAGHTDVSLWYLLRGDVHAPLQFDRREYTDVAWFGFDEILGSHPAIFDAHMHRFVRKLIPYLDKA